MLELIMQLMSLVRTVQNSSLINICAELSLRLREQRLIQIFLLRAEVISANDDSSRWQAQVVGPLQLKNVE